MNSKISSCIIAVVGVVLYMIGIYINFQYPFMHYLVFGIFWGVLLFGVLFVVFFAINTITNKIKVGRKRKQADKIINKNPNGDKLWQKSRKEWRRNDDLILESEKWIIECEENYPLFTKWQEWGDAQSFYNKRCRSLMNEVDGYGYYHYDFVVSQIDEIGKNVKGEHPIWQFFIYAYSSYIISDKFAKEYFGFIINNNVDVEKIKCNNFNLFPDNTDKVIKLFNSILGIYPDLLVLCLIPDCVTNKDDFYNRYYNPITEAISSISFYRIDDPCQLYDEQFKNMYIVLLDCYTEYDKQIKIAEQIVSYFKTDPPYILYLSLFKEYSKQELEELIAKKEEEVRQKKEKVVSLIDQGYEHIEDAQLEEAGEDFKEAAKEIDESELQDSDIKELQNHLKETRDNAIIKYNEIETYEKWDEKNVVDYSIPQDFLQSDDWRYAVAMFPQKGCHVYPFRRGKKTFRIGYTEKEFSKILMNLLPKQYVEVKNDVFLVVSPNKVLETDIALTIANHPSIKIDIEIDEPYEAGNRKPIHYISCGDDVRNNDFLRRGWIVVRFTEKQVKLYPKSCAHYLSRLIKALAPDFVIPKDLECEEPLVQEKRWTQNEALLMAAKREREQYLGHEFNIVQEKVNVYVNFNLSDNERKCNDLTEKPEEDIEFTEKMKSFTDANRYERDKKISFDAHEHIYINKDNEEHFLPVSSLISHFFEGFDALKQAEMQWERYNIPIEESLSKWERIGKMASGVGTFMHTQTENYFKEGFFDTVYHFKFNDCVEEINIEIEKQHFLHFIKDYNIESTIYRQEWPIFDEDLNIAGTIDLTCQVDTDTLIIYDWKRSGKVVNNLGQPVVESYGGKMGIHGLNLPDTSFYHYCIQQNLYRYILQKNYGIKVSELNLVVLWPEFPTYFVAKVPIMDEVVEQIIAVCHQQDLGHRLLS